MDRASGELTLKTLNGFLYSAIQSGIVERRGNWRKNVYDSRAVRLADTWPDPTPARVRRAAERMAERMARRGGGNR